MILPEGNQIPENSPSVDEMIRTLAPEAGQSTVSVLSSC
uniref:Uncharacterized protein n=1 Tax=Escherichia coli TaxID=562 RepID=A0A3G1E133_ECOLX|nr:hypothetical protein plasmid_0185 [Escherichia coli]